LIANITARMHTAIATTLFNIAASFPGVARTPVRILIGVRRRRL
jgi:hypothetical protein